MTFPIVIITSHQGFLTKEVLTNVAETTLQSITDLEGGKELINKLSAEDVLKHVA
jgi:D-lactate dehydrogenase